MADGIAASHMLAGLCDPDVGGVGDSYAHQIRAAQEPKKAPLDPIGALGPLWKAPAALTAGVVRAAQGAGEIAAGLLSPAPSPLNGPLSNMRRYSAARVALTDIERVRQTFGVTINDVALAAITESYRNVLVERGEQPTPESLRTLVPVSTRAADAFGKTDNRVSVMLPNLPVDEANPVQRLRTVHARLDRTKAGGQRRLTGDALLPR